MGYKTHLVALGAMCLALVYFLLSMDFLPHVEKGYFDVLCGAIWFLTALHMYLTRTKDNVLPRTHVEFVRIVLFILAVFTTVVTGIRSPQNYLSPIIAWIGTIAAATATTFYTITISDVADRLDKNAPLQSGD